MSDKIHIVAVSRALTCYASQSMKSWQFIFENSSDTS